MERNSWTTEELEKLKQLAGKLSLDAISIAMCRTKSSLRAKAFKLKIPLQYKNLTWTSSRLDTLQGLRKEGENWESISKTLGCSAASCQRAFSRYSISARTQKLQNLLDEIEEVLTHCTKSSKFTQSDKEFIMKALREGI